MHSNVEGWQVIQNILSSTRFCLQETTAYRTDTCIEACLCIVTRALVDNWSKLSELSTLVGGWASMVDAGSPAEKYSAYIPLVPKGDPPLTSRRFSTDYLADESLPYTEFHWVVNVVNIYLSDCLSKFAPWTPHKDDCSLSSRHPF
eukprot:1231299-Pyramimonas_sp.AAC.1